MTAFKTLVAVALLSPAIALANGYSVPNVNARDLGAAGALVAAQRDAAAAWQNPAALSKLEGLELSFSASLLVNSTTWKEAGRSQSTDFAPAPPPSLWAGYGTELAGRRVGFGAGMTVSAGGNVNWDPGWDGRFRIVTVDRKVYAFAASAGVEVLPQLRLGGGPVYYYTAEYLKQYVDFLTSEGSAEIRTKGGALAYDLSAEITPVLGYPLTIGIDYKHQGVQKLEGEAHYSNVPPPLATSLVDQKAGHVLTIPNTLHVGAAWRPAKEWLVAADYTFDRYQVYKDDTFRGEFATSCPSASCIVVKRNYDNGSSYRLAAEYTVSSRVEVRAGLMRDLSGLQTDTYSPTLPDGDAWIGAAGVSYGLRPNLWLHGSVFYALLDKVTATGTEAFAGAYDTRVFLAAVAVSWRPALGVAQ